MIIDLTPAQLRTVAVALGNGEFAPLGTELRVIAGKLDRGETVTVERPAYEVVYASS